MMQILVNMPSLIVRMKMINQEINQGQILAPLPPRGHPVHPGVQGHHQEDINETIGLGQGNGGEW